MFVLYKGAESSRGRTSTRYGYEPDEHGDHYSSRNRWTDPDEDWRRRNQDRRRPLAMSAPMPSKIHTSSNQTNTGDTTYRYPPKQPYYPTPLTKTQRKNRARNEKLQRERRLRLLDPNYVKAKEVPAHIKMKLEKGYKKGVLVWKLGTSISPLANTREEGYGSSIVKKIEVSKVLDRFKKKAKNMKDPRAYGYTRKDLYKSLRQCLDSAEAESETLGIAEHKVHASLLVFSYKDIKRAKRELWKIAMKFNIRKNAPVTLKDFTHYKNETGHPTLVARVESKNMDDLQKYLRSEIKQTNLCGFSEVSFPELHVTIRKPTKDGEYKPMEIENTMAKTEEGNHVINEDIGPFESIMLGLWTCEEKPFKEMWSQDLIQDKDKAYPCSDTEEETSDRGTRSKSITSCSNDDESLHDSEESHNEENVGEELEAKLKPTTGRYTRSHEDTYESDDDDVFSGDPEASLGKTSEDRIDCEYISISDTEIDIEETASGSQDDTNAKGEYFEYEESKLLLPCCGYLSDSGKCKCHLNPDGSTRLSLVVKPENLDEMKPECLKEKASSEQVVKPYDPDEELENTPLEERMARNPKRRAQHNTYAPNDEEPYDPETYEPTDEIEFHLSQNLKREMEETEDDEPLDLSHSSPDISKNPNRNENEKTNDRCNRKKKKCSVDRRL